MDLPIPFLLNFLPISVVSFASLLEDYFSFRFLPSDDKIHVVVANLCMRRVRHNPTAPTTVMGAKTGSDDGVWAGEDNNPAAVLVSLEASTTASSVDTRCAKL